ncbi:hypothetical protein ACFLU6_04125 [Acidobacteriota bacterium]
MMPSWIWSIIAGVIASLIAAGIVGVLEWLKSKRGAKKLSSRITVLIIGVVFLCGTLLGYLCHYIFQRPRIDIVIPEYESIAYDVNSGYRVTGNFEGKKGRGIYVICKKLGKPYKNVWIVLDLADTQMKKDEWLCVCYLDRISGTIAPNDRFRIQAIMTRDKYNTTLPQNLPRIKNEIVNDFPQRTEFFEIEIQKTFGSDFLSNEQGQ